jgi:ubiquinone/menaquinone biosynthesis C-methylase UbiE
MSTAVNASRVPDARVASARWDRLSRHYDRQLWLERSAVATALDLLAPTSEERLLDVGTGTGEVLRQLSSRIPRPREATGIDWAPWMLAHVGDLPAGWTTRTADVRRLPLPDAAFHVASASFLLHLLAPDDLPVALAEIHRVLRPGGRFVTVTPAIPANGPARQLATVLDRLSRWRPDRFDGLRALDPSPALARAGFTAIIARWSYRGYPSICTLSRT